MSVIVHGTLDANGMVKLDVAPGLPPGPVLITLARADQVANGPPQTDAATRFEKLATAWKSSTKFVSNVSTKILSPDYQKIIGMGKDAIPLILKDLAKN